MPFYNWDPSILSVHVNEMDQEHQVLIKKMNHVYDTYKEQKPLIDVQKAVNDFVDYTVTHFKDEEAYMEKIKFEGVATHKIIHKQLLAQVTEHLEEFKKSGVLKDSFFNFLSVWLTSHIRGIDTKYNPLKK